MHTEQDKSDSVKQQALNALQHLDEKDKEHILKYIQSLLTLDKAENDQRSSTQN